MANHLSLVNQKLNFARVMLAQFEPDRDLSDHSPLVSAQCEAVLLHLYTAYHFYLRELADVNGVKSAALITSLDELSEVLQGSGRQPTEIAELRGLVSERSSWLSRMIASHAQIFQSPKPKTQMKNTSNNLIVVVDLNREEEQALPNHQTLQSWLQEFILIVLRHRETSAEY